MPNDTESNYHREYYLSHQTELKKRRRQRYAANREYERAKQRRNHLWRKYGITPEEYDDMFEAQNGECAICGTRTPGSTGSFFVDHCHETGDVRGLLCFSCNIALGNFKDNGLILRRAIDYLQKHLSDVWQRQ